MLPLAEPSRRRPGRETRTTFDPATGWPPSYVVVGGPCCGAHSIRTRLEAHPEVLLATPGALHYFDRHLDRGVGWYLQHFKPGLEHRAWGEITTSYLSTPDAPSMLRAVSPAARIVCCLREPVSRAYACYRRRWAEPEAGRSRGRRASFEEALASDPALREDGLYARHLRRWLEAFPGDQLLVVLFDDLEVDPRRETARVFRHLGVDAGFEGGAGGGLLADGLRGLRDRLRTWSRERLARDREPVPARVLASLRADYDAPNRELEALLGVDLAAWRAVGAAHVY